MDKERMSKVAKEVREQKKAHGLGFDSLANLTYLNACAYTVSTDYLTDRPHPARLLIKSTIQVSKKPSACTRQFRWESLEPSRQRTVVG